MIAFYYGLTGFACASTSGAICRTPRTLLLVGVAAAPRRTRLLWVHSSSSCIDLWDPENSESGDSWLGIGPPLVIALRFLLLGIVVMLLRWRVSPAFFRRRARPPTRRCGSDA